MSETKQQTERRKMDVMSENKINCEKKRVAGEGERMRVRVRKWGALSVSHSKNHMYSRHLFTRVNSEALIIAGQPCTAQFAHTPVSLPQTGEQTNKGIGKDENEEGGWGWRRVIRTITCQGSVTVNYICPLRLCRDRRGGDPDLPASTDCRLR